MKRLRALRVLRGENNRYCGLTLARWRKNRHDESNHRMTAEPKIKTVYVTGGAGYVGAVLVPKLLAAGYRVRVLDLFMYGENVLPKHANLDAINGDLRDAKLLQKTIPGSDAVIHLACISNDPSFELNPALGKSINFDGRDSGCPLPPAQTRAGVTSAHGSYLGCLASKLAASRTRPSPLGPLARLGVRCGLGCCVFSLVSGLPSTASAGDVSLLFGCFAGTTPLYDSPLPCAKDLSLIAFSLRPANCSRAATGSPGSRAWSFSACLGSSTPRGRAALALSRVALLPSGWPDAVSSPNCLISELHTLPTDAPVQRFKCGLTTALAWLGAGVDRYSFPVRLFHSLLHAGLSRRYPGLAAHSTVGISMVLHRVCPMKPWARCRSASRSNR